MKKRLKNPPRINKVSLFIFSLHTFIIYYQIHFFLSIHPSLSVYITHVCPCRFKVLSCTWRHSPTPEIRPSGCASLIAWFLFTTHFFFQPIKGQLSVHWTRHRQQLPMCLSQTHSYSASACARQRACVHMKVCPGAVCSEWYAPAVTVKVFSFDPGL